MKHNIFKESHDCEKCLNVFEIRPKRLESVLGKSGGRKLCKVCLGNELRKLRIRTIGPMARPNSTSKRPSFTITCKYCQIDFVVGFQFRHRLFCSKICQTSIKKGSLFKNKSLCKICSREFEHYGERHTCDEVCNSRYISQQRIGENNPAWKEDKIIKRLCLNCNQVFSFCRTGLHEGQTRVFCSVKCNHTYQTGRGKDKLGFSGYYHRGKYIGFEKPRKIALQRDNETCRLCGSSEKIHVHHIDYNDCNQSIDNLVSLCLRCHALTKSNRYFWETLFTTLNSGSKVVKKNWGLEIHLANHNEYCFKFLVFWEGKKFSLHFHEKKEIFLSICGRFECRLQIGDQLKKVLIKRGDKLEIEPNVAHQVMALNNSILVEVSTRDYPEDSIRIEPGDSQHETATK